MRACTSAICSATFLSINGFTCAGTLTRAPATLRLELLRLTCAARLGSMRQFAAIFGRAVMTTLPLISALALRFLMFTLPICFATLPPSRPPSASPTAPVAFADSEPVTFSVPVSGVASDSTSCAPVAAIGPREAVQPISAFCRICEIGLSALPVKVARRAAIGGVADRRQRDRNRRHHGGGARCRRQRRQFGERGRLGSWRAARRSPSPSG